MVYGCPRAPFKGGAGRALVRSHRREVNSRAATRILNNATAVLIVVRGKVSAIDLGWQLTALAPKWIGQEFLHDIAFDTRSGPRHAEYRRTRRVRQCPRSRRACRTMGLSPVLGRRASQHAA